ncbi:phage tail protein [Pseudomonas sp. KCJK8670]|uniref:phage tail protein n=1 Tax=Pseudomonas sp. KCJK8670 TaxID=3344558 RepID=UPI0039067666
MDAFTGEIRLFPYTYIPDGWLLCDGSARPIQQFQSLFAVLGYGFGGNTNQFNLPNLNGQVAMGVGAGPGLTARALDASAGADEAMLTPANFAPHTHALRAQPGTNFAAAVDTPTSQSFLSQPRNLRLYNGVAGNTDYTLAPVTVSKAGTPFNRTTRNAQQPYLTLAYCICYDGNFPARP